MAFRLSNTVLRDRIFHFRRAVPNDLRSRLGIRELCCSLRTSDRRLAQLRSRRLYLVTEAIFEKVRSSPMLTHEQIKAIVQDFYSHMLEQDNRIRLKEGRITPELRRRRIEYYRWVADRTREDLGSNNFGSALMTSMAMISRHGLKNLTAEELDQIRQALMRGGIDLADAIRARYEGDFNFEPRDKLLVAKLDAAFAEPSPVVRAASNPDSPPESAEGVRFSKRADHFVAKQAQQGRWEKQTVAQNKKC